MSNEQRTDHEEEQRVIDESPIITLLRITNAPPITLTQNPTTKRNLQATPRLHRRVTRNNLPGVGPATQIEPIPVIRTNVDRTRQRSTTPTQVQPQCGPRVMHSAIPSGAQQRIVTWHAINVLTIKEATSLSTLHTPRTLMKHAKMSLNFEHYANPMVHPVTGKTI